LSDSPLRGVFHAKRRPDRLRSHFYQLWKNTTRHFAGQGKVTDQLTSAKEFCEARGNCPLQPVPFRMPGSLATEAPLARKAQNALKIQTPVTPGDFVEPPPEFCLAGVLSVGGELRPKAMDSMTESPGTDHTILTATNTDQSAADGSDRPHCLPDQPSGMPTRSAEIDPDVGTVPKESDPFVLAELSEGLPWLKRDEFPLRIDAEHLSERTFYGIQNCRYHLSSSSSKQTVIIIIILNRLLNKTSSLLIEAGNIPETLPN
jgi:hypothetical protein